MFLNAKFYNSKGILIREANNDRFSHNTKIYDGNGKLINETENNIQQNEFIFKEYGKNSKLLNETYISFDYNQIGVKAYNNNNILIMESSYTIKNLDINNVKKTMSNLFKNANYQNVLDGYEKFYDDNGNLELEKIYKNGELIDTKEYKVNNYEENSVNEVDNLDTNAINNSNFENNKYYQILEYLNSFSNILKWIILIVIAFIIFLINVFISVKKDEKIENVLMVLTKKKLGAVCISDTGLENGKLLGIITEGDIRRALEHKDKFFDYAASDIMISNPVTIEKNAMALDALHLMENRKSQINVLPVVENGNIVGLIRIHDLIGLR